MTSKAADLVMEEISVDSASSLEETRGERHRSHWTMRCDQRPARRLQTRALVHRTLDLADDDMEDLPPYPSKFDQRPTVIVMSLNVC